MQIQVTTIDNPVDASFFESYEAAHSMHDLTGNIAKVIDSIVHQTLFNGILLLCSHLVYHLHFFVCLKQKLGVKAPPVRIDSQAKYGALARGDGAIYLRFPHKGYREKIWDHAAGYIVVTGT